VIGTRRNQLKVLDGARTTGPASSASGIPAQDRSNATRMARRGLNLDVPDAELTHRRESWTPLPPQIRTGVLASTRDRSDLREPVPSAIDHPARAMSSPPPKGRSRHGRPQRAGSRGRVRAHQIVFVRCSPAWRSTACSDVVAATSRPDSPAFGGIEGSRPKRPLCLAISARNASSQVRGQMESGRSPRRAPTFSTFVRISGAASPSGVPL
jgi:hypothetical protein